MTETEEAAFRQAMSMANYWLVIPVVVISLLSHLSRALRWKLLMKPLNYRPSLKNVFSVVMVGYLANAAVPRLGEILKCTLLARYEKLHLDRLVGTIVVERMFDLLCYLIFIGLTVLIQIDLVGGYVKSKLSAIADAPGLPIWLKLIIGISVLFFFFYLIRFLRKRYPGNKVILKVNSFVRGLIEGIKTIKELKERKLFLAHTLFIWSMYLLQVYIGFSVMESTSHLGIRPAFSVLALATLAMIVTPGGIGSFPIFVKETLLIYGILSPAGTAFGWVLWGANTGIVIITGLAALLLLPILNRKNDEVDTINTSKNI